MKRTETRITITGFLFYLTFALFPFSSFGQSGTDTSNMIRYTPEYKFKEGIFLNFQQVRDNDPIPKSRILTNVDFSDREFYTKVLDSKVLIFYDHFGMKQEVRTDRLWGFSRNGILYISLNDKHHRITIVGNICHFVATVTTYDARYYDPYYYNPYDYYYRYGGYPMNTSSNEMRQFLLDFESGKVYDYDYQALEVLLMKDPELHDEFTQLRKKKKRQLKFLYLRKFNERNPLYLPLY
jgi:hypothetical protein